MSLRTSLLSSLVGIATVLGIAACGDSGNTSYTIGGTVSGLAGTGLVLQNNGGNDVSITTNGNFTFTAGVSSTSVYAVATFSQPSGPVQDCTVLNGSGTVTNADITNVTISCTAPTAQEIAAGGNHTCALSKIGAVACWGSNSAGELGNGTTTDSPTPVAAAGLSSGVTAIATGGYHTCALTSAGEVQCRGWNAFGQLGNGTTTDSATPVAVSGLSSDVIAIVAGIYHTCALTSAGGVQCWGGNGNGELGNGTTNDSTTPVAVTGLSSGATAIAPGFNHTCALITSGAVYCWGSNGIGGLGDGTKTDSTTPVAVTGLSSGVTAIAAGASYTCALTNAGLVYCWGSNSSGKLGNGTTTESTTPVAVTGLLSVTAIAAGDGHTCALTSAGAVQCWGSNLDGQLGIGTLWEYSTTPVSVTGMSSVVTAIAVGTHHTCALTGVGTVQCWGYNHYGQLGDGGLTDAPSPAYVVDFGG